MPASENDDERNWFNFLEFVKSGERIGVPPEPKVLAVLDIDRTPSPTFQVAEETRWLLAVRERGVLSISSGGVRILAEPELKLNILAAFGRAFS